MPDIEFTLYLIRLLEKKDLSKFLQDVSNRADLDKLLIAVMMGYVILMDKDSPCDRYHIRDRLNKKDVRSIVQLLLRLGANINAEDFTKENALILSVRMIYESERSCYLYDYELTKMLFDMGATIGSNDDPLLSMSHHIMDSLSQDIDFNPSVDEKKERDSVIRLLIRKGLDFTKHLQKEIEKGEQFLDMIDREVLCDTLKNVFKFVNVNCKDDKGRNLFLLLLDRIDRLYVKFFVMNEDGDDDEMEVVEEEINNITLSILTMYQCLLQQGWIPMRQDKEGRTALSAMETMITKFPRLQLNHDFQTVLHSLRQRRAVPHDITMNQLSRTMKRITHSATVRRTRKSSPPLIQDQVFQNPDLFRRISGFALQPSKRLTVKRSSSRK